MTVRPKSPLKQLVIDLLREDALETVPPVEGGDSLDAQVDRYLSDYEASSKTTKQEGSDFRRMTRRLLEGPRTVFEADDDEKDDAAPDTDVDTSGDAGAEPTKATLENIDMEEFSNDVARLIQNYDNLLEIKNTILRRAINFVSKGYDQASVDSLTSLMKNKHGIVDGESKQDVEDEIFKAPPADRAGPGGAGA